MKVEKVKDKATAHILDAVQWDGDVPFPEEFESLGYLEADNGVTLYAVDHDVLLEPGKKEGVLRIGDWVLKTPTGEFALVTDKWFKANLEIL